MNTKKIAIFVVVVIVATLLISGKPAFAWDVQEKVINNTGQDAYDLTKVVEGPEGDIVTKAIQNQLGDPNIVTYPATVMPTALSVIHWGVEFPGDMLVPGPPVPPNGSVWACYNASGPTKPATAFWSDQEGNPIEGMAAVEVYVSERRENDGSVWIDVEHSWRDRGGMRWPPTPDDVLGDFLGPITGTDVYYAIANVERSLEQLNEDLYNDPDITWNQLDDFQLDNGGDRASYNLGDQSSSDFMLLRFVASGEGIQTETILQFQPSPIIRPPAVSEWGLIVMAMLLMTVGAIVIHKRRQVAV
jgi:hypothetical protein